MRKKKHYMVNISGDGDGNGSSKKTTNRHENAIKLFEDTRKRVEDWDGPITAGPAKMDGWLQPREEVLTGILSDLFGWTDRTYLHAVMHVQNAVLDLQARAAGAQKRLDHLTARMQDLAGYECEYGDGCPDFSGTRCRPCKELSNLLLYQEACGTSDGLEDRAALQSEVESHSVAVQKIRDTITQNDLPCGHPKSCLIFADNGPYEAPGEFCGWCSEAWPVEALRNQVRELKVLVESISQIQVSSLSGPGQADLIRSTKCRLCGAPNKTHTKDCPVGKAFRV